MKIGDIVRVRWGPDMITKGPCVVISAHRHDCKVQRISAWGSAAPIYHASVVNLERLDPNDLTDEQVTLLMRFRLSGEMAI